MHIPTVVSRNPLWDEHDEERDPHYERVLAQGRLTLATHWRHATPQAVSRMPEDTAAPLTLALLLTAVACAVLLRELAWTGVLALCCLANIAYWLWPHGRRDEELA